MRLHLVDVVSDGRQHGLNRLRRQLRALSLAQQQLGAMGVEFWRAALVILDMGVAMADDAAVGWTERRQRQRVGRSEEHTSELQSLMRISYAVFCLKKKKKHNS